MNSGTIKVALADDHRIVRQGLRLVLEQALDFELAGEAADGLAAVDLVREHNPHVLVVDLMLPRLHGLEVVKQVTREFKNTKALVLSMYSDEPFVMEALRNGASGYLLKDCDSEEFLKAIRAVHAGKKYLSEVLADRALTGYLEHPGKSQLDVYDTLTNRERTVLQLAAEGLSSTKIAAKLFISPRTAETHRANLMRKLALSSQTDLVRFAIRKGIIPA
ncbi:MAG: DNA-binding response regulator [Verrucomicrobiales bacterium]|nr:DNA-binding response regulator [Verrucomicrobiales bacterium]|tara:strand:+ start:327 stop:983 length:657 start_codon:yes stop_codon:yes gene_type:complete